MLNFIISYYKYIKCREKQIAWFLFNIFIIVIWDINSDQ